MVTVETRPEFSASVSGIFTGNFASTVYCPELAAIRLSTHRVDGLEQPERA